MPNIPPVGRQNLTPRESSILRLIGLGMDCQAIARQLSISPLTARKHRSNILTKTGLKTAVQLAIFAVELEFRRRLRCANRPFEIGAVDPT
ncbi:response regulator transcription factor [Pseudomonas sp. 18175]|uniref:response regulator transcription factor n=1 Tax=Pseudomonas sp. 18175 TaxID=3390056 RepID=UPI003D1FB812